MKKNIIVILTMLLILSMFVSMAYVKLFGKDAVVVQEEDMENVEQHLKINIGSEPPTLHPGLATDSTSVTVLHQMFEGLTRIDIWGQTVNATASVIKITDDQKTYKFTLRNAVWSNGDPVIAKDFEYAWKWLLDPNNNSKNAYQLYSIEGAKSFHEGKGSVDEVGVTALDDKNLEVKLVEPTPNFLELITLPAYYPINSKMAEKNPDWATEAGNEYTTNGPFELTDWNHNEEIVLTKNNKYWDVISVKLKKITMQMINDSNEKMDLYDNGGLNWGGIATKELFLEDEQELFDEYLLDIHTQSVAGSYTVKMNTKVEPFNNKNIRRALALAINRNEIIENTVLTGDISALTTVPSWLSQENTEVYFKDNDVENAKKHLQLGLNELGYENVSQLPAISISSNADENDKSIAESIQKMWQDHLGVTVIIDSSDWDNHNNKIQDLNYEVALLNTLSDFKDPLYYLESYRDADSESNGTGWENEEFQSYLEKSRVEVDIENRQTLLEKAESVLMEDMPVIPISFYTFEYTKMKDLIYSSASKTGHVQYKWANFQELEDLE